MKNLFLIFIFLLSQNISKKHHKNWVKPEITYTPIGWATADVAPESTYEYRYDPVRRVYTYAPSYYFQQSTYPQVDFSPIKIHPSTYYDVTRPLPYNRFIGPQILRRNHGLMNAQRWRSYL